MSLQIFNDENVTSEKNAENRDFLFSPPELSGRSSVLRLSQKDNVLPKNQAKTAKVNVGCNFCAHWVLKGPLTAWHGGILVRTFIVEQVLSLHPPTGDFSDTFAGPTDAQDLKS
jgi:hypothetical protein